jgi:hypothetical protein
MLDQIGSQGRKQIALPLCEAVLDRYVPAFDETTLVQATMEGSDQMTAGLDGPIVEKPDHRHRREAVHERPRYSSAGMTSDGPATTEGRKAFS